MGIASRASRAGIINPVLTGYFQDSTNGLDHYVGDKIAPYVDIDGLGASVTTTRGNGEINLFENPDFLQPLADNAPAKMISKEDDTFDVKLDRHSFGELVPLWRVIAAQKQGVPYDATAMRILAQKTRAVHELKVLESIGTVGNYDNTTAVNYQASPSASLIVPLQNFIDTIGSNIRYDPNMIVMNPVVATWLARIDEIKAWNGSASNNASAVPNRHRLAQFFKEEFGLELVIAREKYTDASNSRGYIFGKNIALLRTDGAGFPTFAQTFLNNWLGQFGSGELGLAGVRSVEQENPKGLLYLTEMMMKVQLDNSAAGALFTGVIT